MEQPALDTPSNNNETQKGLKSSGLMKPKASSLGGNRFGYKKPPVAVPPEVNNNQVATANNEEKTSSSRVGLRSKASTVRVSTRSSSSSSVRGKATASVNTRKKPVRSSGYRSNNTKAITRSKAAVPDVSSSNNNNDNHEDDEEEETSTDHLVPKTIHDVLDNIIKGSLVEEMEQALGWRPKTKKYDTRGRADEQMKIIMRMRTLLTQILDGYKSSKPLGLIFEQHQAHETQVLTSASEALEQQNRHTAQVLAERQAQVQKLEQELAKSEQENLRKKEKYKDSLLTLTQKCEHESSQRLRFESEIATLRLDKTEQRGHYQRLEDQLAESQALVAKLRQDICDKEDTIAWTQTSSDERMEVKCSELTQELLAKDQTISDLQTQVQAAETQVGDVSDLQQHLEKLELENQEIKVLKDKLERKENEVSQIVQSLTRAQEFNQDQTSARRDERSKLQDKIEQFEAQVKAQESELMTSRLELQSLTSQYEFQSVELHKTRAELENQSSQFELLKDWKQQHEVQVTGIQEVRQVLELQLAGSREEILALNAQVEALRVEHAVKIQRLSSELESKSSELDERSRESLVEQAATKKKMHKFENEHRALEAELETLRNHQSTQHSVEALALAEARGQIEMLRHELDGVQRQEHSSSRVSEALVAELNEQLRRGEMMRRKMHNTIQELRGNIRVFARTRPFLPSDGGDHEGSSSSSSSTPLDSTVECCADGQRLELHVPSTSTANKKGKTTNNELSSQGFSFDKVFPPSTGQDEIFEEVSEFIQSALDGYHVCLFSYGQTGSGKTYTMQGTGQGQMRGVIPRSLEKVLDTATRQSSSTTASGSGSKQHCWTYSMEVSFLEIYNEQIYDLLVSSTSGSSSGANNDNKLVLKQKSRSDAHVHVAGLTKVPVDNLAQVESIMDIASRNRSVGSTDMNAQSSRSHSVFSLYIHGSKNDASGGTLTGQLNLVDLAGSERLSRSGATGDRLRETQSINKSLSCLTDVFTALGQKASHIPFRNSKLTHLLQPCLSGDGKTLMMVNLSPTSESYFESLCSLRFATKVNQVELGKAKRNIESGSTSSSRREKPRDRGSSVPPSTHPPAHGSRQ